jgi:hypothetical protein
VVVKLTFSDIVARKAIQKHDEITLDYATFCGESMPIFECHCGSSTCRKEIKGTDYKQPFVRKEYGDHISSWVKSKSH